MMSTKNKFLISAKKIFFIIWLTCLGFLSLLAGVGIQKALPWLNKLREPSQITTQVSQSIESVYELSQPSPSPTPTPQTAKISPKKPADPYTNNPDLKNAEWGEAVKTESGSYTMKVGMDPQMSTASELYEALMTYRQIKGKSRLTWDDKLAAYATERAAYICKNGTDHHAGFTDFLENQDGYMKLGFRHLGENMSVGMRLSGVHLIEWIYSKSPGHEANQTGQWSHIGTGISGNCSALIFGDYKL